MRHPPTSHPGAHVTLSTLQTPAITSPVDRGAAEATRSQLAAITAALTAPGTTIGETALCVSQLEALLEQHSPFRRADDITDGESVLPTGWAVSPTQAAMCARDYRRTYTFARGLALAIADAQHLVTERPVRVLYAGCGPWALIALSSMATLPGETVRFTLLDAHQTSIDSVRALVTNLGLEPSVDAIICADATAWTIPTDLTPDVIVTETMNVCLAREPQVAITRHLLRQAPHAILVPRSVRIDAVLVDPACERPATTPEGQGPDPVPDRIELGTLFEVSRERVAAWPETAHGVLPAATLHMPTSIDARYVPRLFTRIHTYGDERLDAYESWLTDPRRFPRGVSTAPGSVITFRYVLGASPRLEEDRHEWPDRVRLPLRFDPQRLEAELTSLETVPWTDHFVTRNYTGRWTIIALRAPTGTESQHPILQITSHPGMTDFVDTPALTASPYFAHVLRALGFPVGPVRLMRLDPGSTIRTHRDDDLDASLGWARLHIPIRTNPGVEFLLNSTPVMMAPGECWYLRLSDPHSVRNDGDAPRTHLVIDAPMTPGLQTMLREASQSESSQAL